jgi:hypothetical protein
MRPRPALLTVLTSLAAAALATSSAVAAPAPSVDNARTVVAATDTDGDSLPDAWETNGYDANGDGVVDVDLPAMGADPQKKDLFVEMGYMYDGASRSTSTQAPRAVRRTTWAPATR